jgi:hypothetical protein
MASRRRTTRPILAAAVLAPALLVPGCNGVTDPERERTVIADREWTLEPLTLLVGDLDITGVGEGRVDATVEWTLASNDVDLYVTAQACTAEMFNRGGCAFRAQADSATAKPERLTFNVSGGDRYKFWIVNVGPQRESGTLQMILSRD